MDTITTLPAWKRRLLRAQEHETVPADKPGKKPMTEHAKCAKMIRTQLATVFPGVKFSVRSDSFSMGDSVDIEWTDGPTVAMVEEVTQRYQYGHFDGMQDLYEYSNNRSDIPQAKYVHENRHMSPQAIRDIIEYLNRCWGYALVLDERTGWIDPMSDGPRGNNSGWQSQDIWRRFSPHSLLCDACNSAIRFEDKFCAECGTELTAIDPNA